MRKIILCCLFIAGLALTSEAQEYRTAIGLRAGYPAGLTLKHFIRGNTVVEGLLTSRWRGFEITGLYEINKPRAFDVDRLNWYYGFGAHIGFWNGKYTYAYWGTTGSQYTVIGIDGILGIEYNFDEIPINLGLDWKPAFNIIGYTGFWADGVALSVRYMF